MALTLSNFPSYSPDFKFSFTNTNYDLSEYQNKLASRRDEKSLFLRRIGLPGMKKTINKSYEATIETDSNSLTNDKMIFKQSLESRNSDQVVSLCKNMLASEKSFLPILAFDENIIESIINAVNSFEEFSAEAISILFGVVKSIVTISPDITTTKIIDEIGITLSILIQNSLDEIDTNNFEEESANSIILPFALDLIQAFTKYSLYSRSAMISFGILDSIMMIASKNIDDDLTNNCLNAICTILTKHLQRHKKAILKSPSFSSSLSSESGSGSRRIRAASSSLVINHNTFYLNNDLASQTEFKIDVNNVENIINPLFELLRLKIEQNSDITTISIIFNIFLELTNNLPILIKRFYDNGLFDIALDLITVPELTKTSINLIGNLPISTFLSTIQSMVEKGLFEKLMELIEDTEFTSDVYWTLSNFLSSTPQFILPLIDQDLISLSLEISSQAPFNVKREIAYFLSALIIASDNDTIADFLASEDIIELLAEMLNSGVENLTIKCISAFQKIFDISIELNSSELNCESLLQLFDTYDVVKQLDEIVQQIDQQNTLLISVASKLFSDIENAADDQQ